MDLDYYDFKDQLGSTEWIQELPKGYVSERVDLRYSEVSITKEAHGYSLYIGPKSPEQGGDAIQIQLNSKFQLIDYEVERIAPLPSLK
jgi:hypothetical protein